MAAPLEEADRAASEARAALGELTALEARIALGRALRRARERAGIEVATLARTAAIDPAELMAIEEGRSAATLERHALLAAACGHRLALVARAGA